MHPLGVIVIFFFFSFFFYRSTKRCNNVKPYSLPFFFLFFFFFLFYQPSRFGGKYLDFIFEAIFRDTGQISFIIKKCFKSFCSISGSTRLQLEVSRNWPRFTQSIFLSLSLSFFDAYQLTLLPSNGKLIFFFFFFLVGIFFPLSCINFVPFSLFLFFFPELKNVTVKFKPLSTAIPKLFNEYEA